MLKKIVHGFWGKEVLRAPLIALVIFFCLSVADRLMVGF